jgi:3-dehydroquinate synthase
MVVTQFDISYANARTRVIVAPGSLELIGSALSGLVTPTKTLVVSDETVAALYARATIETLHEAGFETDLLALPPGDATKSLASASLIYDRMSHLQLSRDGLVVALGGGMVSDLAGFAAATWMRGVPVALCPTTVEADIDACIGGKTAINHPAGKNLIGAFHQPVLVNIDPLCLRTLEHRDVVAGMGESIKHAAIADEPFLTWHENHRERVLANDPEAMVELVVRNVRIKANVVSRDERERTPVRASLNFGHTIGHAIEAAHSYALRHGECVALGMVAAGRICVAMSLLRQEACDRLIRCIASYGLPTRLERPPDTDDLRSYMARDKKAAAGRVRFTLLDGLGATVLCDNVPEPVVREAIESLGR